MKEEQGIVPVHIYVAKMSVRLTFEEPLVCMDRKGFLLFDHFIHKPRHFV